MLAAELCRQELDGCRLLGNSAQKSRGFAPAGEEDLREPEEAAGRRPLPGSAGPRLQEELQHVHLPRPLAVRPAGPAPCRRVGVWEGAGLLTGQREGEGEGEGGVWP